MIECGASPLPQFAATRTLVMRLLHIQEKGEFSLTKDLITNIPPYAILSHTWGDEDEEVTFHDFMEGSGKTKAGYEKIRFCGARAAQDGLRHFWVGKLIGLFFGDEIRSDILQTRRALIAQIIQS
jgi:hypothetical protein